MKKESIYDCWLLSNSIRNSTSSDELYTLLKKHLMKHNTIHDIGMFNVPFDLRFKSFDTLLTCADELEKEDQTVESSLKRARQLAVDINPSVELKVHYDGRQYSLSSYVSKFVWDDRKFPKYLPISENLKNLSQLVHKLMDDLILKSVAYNELKYKRNSINSNSDGNIQFRDLVYVITPDVVESNDDFMETNHLTTVVVYVPISSQDDFLNTYMTFSDNIVPNSAKHINLPKSTKTGGIMLWRVVLFKSSVEKFIESCKSNGYNANKFVYSEDRYRQLLEEQSRLETDAQRQQAFLSRIYDVAHSDIFIYWVHLKAMRVFCESVLKFGLPVQFASLFIFPVSSKQEQLHKILYEMIPKYSNSEQNTETKEKEYEKCTDTSFLPYVFLSFKIS
ncbi:V-ATPase subunit C family protein [Theileria parva strain Muguga]|uniref:V-ATPase subunit C family protein n=1 Tax=Theileria parva strain Muguga TaxID=333668 RepID=UPI001C61A121|nr:V-ATPase subunit C family protein [Theileria parva strain Muguga]EAN32320.2 V-ATPase subunit C family protein [Theileria parva strain Muguga]